MLIEILILIAGVYVGWNIGANDAANCVGADVGSGRMTVREGIIITAVFSFLGAMLFGSKVTKTIGRGIVPLKDIVGGSYADYGISSQTGLYMILAASIAIGLWLMFATYFKLPVSTSHSAVGAVAGTGVALLGAIPIKWSVLGNIALSWVLTPIGACILAFLFYKPFVWIFGKTVPRKYEDKVTRFLIICTSVYLAFTWGANDVANATGIIAGTGIKLGTIPVDVKIATLIGAIAIVLGIVIWGRRVIETVGFGITNMLPLMTITAEIASGTNIFIYTYFGMPVSTTHSIIGAVAGVGLWHGIRGVNLKTLRDIGFAMVGTPFIAGTASFIILKTILVVIG